MSTLKAIVAASLACLAVAAPAQTTDAQMKNALKAPMPSDYDDTTFVHAFGLCAARDVPVQSRKVLRAMPASEASDRALFWTVVTSNSCDKEGKAFNFTPRAMRGPVAEYYLKRDFDLATWKPRRELLKIFAMPIEGQLDSLSPDTRAEVVMLAIGACVHKADAAAVGRLFETQSGSSEEAAAFSALAPVLSGCLPAGVQLKMSKFQVRGFLAEAAYRAAAEAAGNAG